MLFAPIHDTTTDTTLDLPRTSRKMSKQIDEKSWPFKNFLKEINSVFFAS